MRSFILLTSAALVLAACSGEKPVKLEKANSAQSEQSAEPLSIKGTLSYRERIALRPGLTASVTLSDVSIADRKAHVLATQEFELRGLQVPIPFELSVDREKLKPNGRYSVRGTLIGPEGALMWATDTAHIINTAKTSQDLGDLTIVRTEARRRTRVNFYQCGSIEVETRLSEGEMTLMIDGEETGLPKVPAASGTKYLSGSGADKLMFWRKGETAQLQIGAKTYPECTVIDLK